MLSSLPQVDASSRPLLTKPALDPTHTQGDLVLAARAALRRALRSRKVAELEAAVEAGETAGLYGEELEQGRRALDMERKAAVRARMKEAQRAHNVELWYAAVRDGQTVGLSNEVLSDTLRELNIAEARANARTKIRQAAREGVDVDDLEAALTLGEQVGLTGNELARGRALLASMKEKADAQKSLTMAVASRNLGELQQSMGTARLLRLDHCPEFKEAEKTLQQEAEWNCCRNELKDACLRKSPTPESQLTDLRSALAHAKAAELPDAELSRARGMLAEGEDLQLARGLVRDAEESQRLDDLRRAIKRGEEAGMDKSELVRPRQLLVDAYKPAAREKLKAAVASRSIQELEAAIRYGQEVGITKVGLAEAQETLVAEERKARARTNLREVAGSHEIQKLFTAITVGEGVCLPETELAPYRVVLQEEQRKAAARELLTTAVQSGSQSALQAALDEGCAVGLEAAELTDAQRTLARELIAETGSNLATALESLETNELEAAVAAAESGRPRIDNLLSQVGDEDVSIPYEVQLEEAKQILSGQLRKVRARERLREAEKRRDLEDLRAACQEGEAMGLSYIELRGAQAALAEEELRVPALLRLSEAVQSRGIENLRAAIINGDKAKLTRAELREARELLADEERKANARMLLAVASQSHNAKDLKRALTKARKIGLSEEELAAFEANLAQEWRNFACDAIAAAEKSGLPELRKAIRQAERLGVSEEETSRAKAVLAERRLEEVVDSDAVTSLRTAISEGERRVPSSSQLPPARSEHAAATRREAARHRLNTAAKGSDIPELLAAVKAGRKEGLEDWELEPANLALHHLRRIATSTDETLRRVVLTS